MKLRLRSGILFARDEPASSAAHLEFGSGYIFSTYYRHTNRRRTMKKSILTLALLGLFSATAQAGDGLISVKSAHDVPTTTDKLVAVLEEKGMKVFARIDHAAGAKKVEMTLEPTELVIFGNPKMGTALMKCGHGVAIDLPLKALVWEDGDGQTWLGYNDPAFLAERHKLEGCDKVLEKMGKGVAGFAKAATE
jgi:uncharacterized protein (DUF302 family)